MLRISGIFVVALWLVMTAVLAQKTTAPDERPTTASIRTGESWMGIYLEGGKVGYAMTRVEKSGPGYSVTEDMVTSIGVMGTTQEVRTTTVSKMDEALKLRSFVFEMKSGFADMAVKGSVEGKTLKLSVLTAGSSRKAEVALTDTPHLSSDLELYVQKEGLAVGKKLRMPFFDPATMSNQYMDLTVEALEDLKLGDKLVPVYRIREQYAGITATTWYSPELGSVKGEGPMGFTFLKETKEQARKKPVGGYAPADLIALASIPVTGEVADSRGTSFLRVRLSGVDLSGLMLSGGRQEYSGGVLTVSRENMDRASKASLPVTDTAMDEYLRPDTMVQSDDPGIKKKAREATGGETDALSAAMKLAGWVNQSVEKQPSAGIPSAVEVLENLKGDCNEHTVLFTALARSVGLPARMIAGIVMLNGRFYYHAWPEVYAGRWISIDPTFGQFPADATHIRLIEGGPDKQIAILKVVGRLKVEILEYK